MGRTIVILGTLLYLLGSTMGCSAGYNKGVGSIITWQSRVDIGSAPASHSFGLETPMQKHAGPATIVAGYKPPDSTYVRPWGNAAMPDTPIFPGQRWPAISSK